jgi:hypothetical protein
VSSFALSGHVQRSVYIKLNELSKVTVSHYYLFFLSLLLLMLLFLDCHLSFLCLHLCCIKTILMFFFCGEGGGRFTCSHKGNIQIDTDMLLYSGAGTSFENACEQLCHREELCWCYCYRVSTIIDKYYIYPRVIGAYPQSIRCVSAIINLKITLSVSMRIFSNKIFPLHALFSFL